MSSKNRGVKVVSVLVVKIASWSNTNGVLVLTPSHITSVPVLVSVFKSVSVLVSVLVVKIASWRNTNRVPTKAHCVPTKAH